MQEVVQQILISSGLFVFLWIVLGRGVFKPFIELIEEREQRTAGDDKRSLELKDEAQRTRDRVDSEIKQARLRAIASRDEVVGSAKKEANKIVEEANAKAEQKLEAARAEIEALSKKAEAELASEVSEIAEVMHSKIISPSSQMVH